MIENIGKKKRLERIFRDNGKTFIVPVDDLLICGPNKHLETYDEKILKFNQLPVDAVLGFPGVFNQFYDSLKQKSWIINLTTSTFLNNHTNKKLSLTLQNAISNGAEAVAVHVNMTSPNENEMIQNLGLISCECQTLGIPLMAIVYARKPGVDKDDNYELLKANNNSLYTDLVSHACRVAVELGADIIKTNYTGNERSFKKVIRASGNVPVVIAGGDFVDEGTIIKNTQEAINAGASGVCFGRNFFYRDNIVDFAEKIERIIKNG